MFQIPENFLEYIVEELAVLEGAVARGLLFSTNHSSENQDIFIAYPNEVEAAFSEGKKQLTATILPLPVRYNVHWLPFSLNPANSTEEPDENTPYCARFTDLKAVQQLLQSEVKRIIFLISVGKEYHCDKQLKASVNLFSNLISACQDITKNPSIYSSHDTSGLKLANGRWEIRVVIADTLQSYTRGERATWETAGKKWRTEHADVYFPALKAAGGSTIDVDLEMNHWDELILKSKNNFFFQKMRDQLRSLYFSKNPSNDAKAFKNAVDDKSRKYIERNSESTVVSLNHTSDNLEAFSITTPSIYAWIKNELYYKNLLVEAPAFTKITLTHLTLDNLELIKTLLSFNMRQTGPSILSTLTSQKVKELKSYLEPSTNFKKFNEHDLISSSEPNQHLQTNWTTIIASLIFNLSTSYLSSTFSLLKRLDRNTSATFNWPSLPENTHILRDTYLTALNNFFSRPTTTNLENYPRILIFWGGGGLGKTHLATTWQQPYRLKLWIDGSDIGSSFKLLASELGLLKNTMSPKKAAASVCQWLSNNPGWLLVIDNVNEPSILDGYLPLEKNAKEGPRDLIITSRRNNWKKSLIGLHPEIRIEELEIRNMAPKESKELLEKASERTDLNYDLLSEKLSHMPLALHKVGIYLRQNIEVDANLYIARYDNITRDLSNKAHCSLNKDPITLSYAVVFTCVVDELRRMNYRKKFTFDQLRHAVGSLTIALSYLNTNEIPLVELKEWFESQHLNQSTGLFDDLIKMLEKFSLISKNEIAETISMDQILQDSIRLCSNYIFKTSSIPFDQPRLLLSLSKFLIESKKSNYSHLRCLAKYLKEQCHHLKDYDDLYIKLLNSCKQYSQDLNHYSDCALFMSELRSMQLKRNPRTNTKILDLDLALMNSLSGNIDEAAEILKTVFLTPDELRRREDPIPYLRIVTFTDKSNNYGIELLRVLKFEVLGIHFMNAFDFITADSYIRAAINISEFSKNSIGEHSALSHLFDERLHINKIHIGMILSKFAKYDEAITAIKAGLHYLKEPQETSQIKHIIKAYQILAETLFLQGHYSKGHHYARKAHVKLMTIYPRQHPEIAYHLITFSQLSFIRNPHQPELLLEDLLGALDILKKHSIVNLKLFACYEFIIITANASGKPQYIKEHWPGFCRAGEWVKIHIPNASSFAAAKMQALQPLFTASNSSQEIKGTYQPVILDTTSMMRLLQTHNECVHQMAGSVHAISILDARSQRLDNISQALNSSEVIRDRPIETLHQRDPSLHKVTEIYNNLNPTTTPTEFLNELTHELSASMRNGSNIAQPQQEADIAIFERTMREAICTASAVQNMPIETGLQALTNFTQSHNLDMQQTKKMMRDNIERDIRTGRLKRDDLPTSFWEFLTEGPPTLSPSTSTASRIRRAAGEGHVEMLEQLLVINPSLLDDPAGDGNTALHFATKQNQATCVMLLLEKNASYAIKNNHGKTAVDLAIEIGNPEIISLFRKHIYSRYENAQAVALDHNSEALKLLLSTAKPGDITITETQPPQKQL